jgi:threonine dehydratase
VKHENHQPTDAFKIRGGINLVSQFSAEEKRRGVVTASTDNHGQSIALASRMFGVRAIICVPRNPNPDRVRAIRSFGAEIVEEGRDFEEARSNTPYMRCLAKQPANLIGTTEQVATRIREYMGLGVDHFILRFHFGEEIEGMRLFTEKVRPRL